MLFSDRKTHIMGILNVTPDSFYDGGTYFDNVKMSVAHAKQMVADGADIIDIGGESTRPGSEAVDADEEVRRVLPIIEQLSKEIKIPISIDTYKPRVALRALEAGATILNDVTGLTQPEMLSIAAKWKCPVVIMHMQGQPKTMQTNPHYDDVIEDIKKFFADRMQAARAAGVEQLILDPGIGFGKTVEHNLTILKRLQEFADLGYPLLVGPSRKSFIGQLTGGLPATERLEGTIAAVSVASWNGAKIVRVHDVAACRKALCVVDAIKAV